VLPQYFAAVQNLSSCCQPSAYGVERGFSNYGSRPQMGLRNAISYAVSCLLWFLPELSNDNKNQAQQVMRCYTMIVSTY